LYKFKISNDNLNVVATLAIATYYLISWIFSLFTSFQPVHYGNSMMSIESAFCNNYCCIKLVLDFDRIEKGVEKMPKFMEWFGAMGLMITLVWLELLTTFKIIQ
jgi:uncharacterized YccA/Bax inhibitor family protein